VLARPAVRPLSAPLPEEPAAAEAASEPPPALEVPAPASPVREAFVVPDESDTDADELDLFKPQAARRKPVVVEEDGEGGGGRPDAGARARRLPIFKIGGRLEAEAAAGAAPLDDEASALRSARVRAFLDGVRSLKCGIERSLPPVLSQRKAIALCCCGAALVIMMGAGIALLFKMTGANVGAGRGAAVEAVAASPSLYVD
jgi:hypothetical protein